MKNQILKSASIWLITLIISVGGGFIGTKLYMAYIYKPVKFYQFDLVAALKNESAYMEDQGVSSKRQAKAMFTAYLEKLNERLKKYSKKGIVFVKGAVVAGNVKNITNKVVK